MKHYRSRNSLHNLKIVQEWFVQFDARAEMVWAIGLLCRKSLLNLPSVQEWFSQYVDHAWAICTIWRSCRNGLLNLKIVQEMFGAIWSSCRKCFAHLKDWAGLVYARTKFNSVDYYHYRTRCQRVWEGLRHWLCLNASSRHFYFQNHPNLLLFLFLY